MPMYRMTRPEPTNREARETVNAEAFEAACLGEALEHSCRKVRLFPEDFGSNPGQYIQVVVEDVETGRTLSDSVRFIFDQPSIWGEDHV